MRLIIIGASGMIGSTVEAAARKAGHQVIGTYATNPGDGLVPFDMTKTALLEVAPDLGATDCVMLMSARIDQAWVESHPAESHRINFLGAVDCAEATLSRGAHFVFMSSEAVFGGVSGAVNEGTTPSPITLYAQQKVKVENCLPRGKACIVRTGSVVGWSLVDRRCAISQTHSALLKPGAKMAHDNTFTVTDIEDVAGGLLQVIERRVCGIVHIAAKPSITRQHLAECIMSHSRHKGQMSYQRVRLSALPQVKGGRAWLDGKINCDPRSLVERKVALLDQGIA